MAEQPIPMEDTQYSFDGHPFSSFMKEKNVGADISDRIMNNIRGIPAVSDASGLPAPGAGTAALTAGPEQQDNRLYEAVHPNTLNTVLGFIGDHLGSSPTQWWNKTKESIRNPIGWVDKQLGQLGIEKKETPAYPWEENTAPIDMTRDPTTGGYVAPPYTGPAPWRRGIPNEINTPDPNAMATSEAPIPMGRFRVGNEAWRDIPENYESPAGRATLSTVNTGPQSQPMLVTIGGQEYSLSPDVLNEMAKNPGRYADQGYYGAHPEEKAAQDAYDLIRPPGENSYEGAVARMKEMNLRDVVNNPNSTKEARAGAANQLALMTKDRAVANTAADTAYTKILGQGMEFGPGSPLSQERIAKANYYNEQPEVQRQWHTETAQARVEAARERAQARMEEAKDRTSQKREKDQLDLYNRTLNRFKTKTKDMMSGNETEGFDSEKAAPEIEKLIKAGKLSEDFRINAPEQNQMTTMPSPGEHKGRTIRDTQTGKRFKSDGKNWVEMK